MKKQKQNGNSLPEVSTLLKGFKERIKYFHIKINCSMLQRGIKKSRDF